ncbi:hypothetical protein RI367_003440 [Sorochytrium milnesiophthora]
MQALLGILYSKLGGGQRGSSQQPQDDTPATAKSVDHEQIEHLPLELYSHIIALAGVRICAISRCLPALKLIVSAYNHGPSRSRKKEEAAVRVCVAYKWSAGVELLVLNGFGHALARYNKIDSLVLSPAAVEKLWPIRNTLPLASVVCNALDTHDDSARWCCERSRPFAQLLGAQLIKRGRSLDALRALWQQLDNYVDDEDLAWTFVCDAARSNRLELLQAMHPHSFQHTDLFACAAESGNLEVVQFVDGVCGFKDYGKAITAAAANGFTDLVRWLIDHRPVGKVDINLAEAVRGNNLDIFLQLWRLDPPDKNSGIAAEVGRSALQHNAIAVIPWLSQQDASSMRGSVPLDILRNVQLPAFQWLLASPLLYSKTTLLDIAARHGRWDLLRWAVPAHPELCHQTMVIQAIGHGHRRLAEWLCKQINENVGTVEDRHRLQIACAHAYFCRLDELQDLNRRYPFAVDDSFMRYAINDCNTDIARWLCQMKPDIAISKDLLDVMATHGDLAMLQWAATRPGTPALNDTTMQLAVLSGRLHTVEWIHLRHPDLQYTRTNAIDDAAYHGRLDIVRFLHEHQLAAGSSTAIDSAAAGGWLDVVVWLHERGYTGCTTAAMDKAASSGHLHVVRWLHENRQEGCTTNAMTDAARNGWLNVVKFLAEHRSEGCTPPVIQEVTASGRPDIARWLRCATL